MMTQRKKMILLALLFTLFTGNIFAQGGHIISLKAPDFAGKEVILAEYFTTRMVPKDTIQLNLLGEGTFAGPDTYDGGLYIIYFDAKYYFDFLLDKDQYFSVSADSSDLINKTKFDGSPNNYAFYEYKRYLTKKRKQQSSLIEELASAGNAADSARINDELEILSKELTNQVERLITKYDGLFFSTFLLSMEDKMAPDNILVGTQRQKDSIKYVYFKDHYFDNYDFTDIRLLHTPLYERKIKSYINRVVPQHPDSIIAAVDFILEKSKINDDIFRTNLINLFNNFAESKLMGMDKVYFHIAEKYYIPDATWSSEEFITKLKENLVKSKPTFIGNIAPDFELKALPKEHFQMAAMDTAIKRDPYVGTVFNLHDVKAEYTLLYFWESDCGHCQKSTPILYDIFKKYKDQDVKVLAVHVINSIEGKEKWIDFVNEHEMLDWINCWSPHNNDFRNAYNLLSFPQLFLLDKDKKIIAKGLSPEQVGEILERFLNN